MIALLQRVSEARVDVAAQTVGRIDHGLAVLVGVERDDATAEVERLADRLVAYRIFADAEGRMNLDVRAVGGAILLVPQFTLAADTGRGNRPSFTPAAPPEAGRALFEAFVAAVRRRHEAVECGRFGAHMQVSLCNDGPVTFWLQVPPAPG